MRTIHIKGWSNKIDLISSLSDNYKLDVNFNFDEETEEVIPNVFFRFYECDKECSLDEAIENTLRKEFGDLRLLGEEYGYSEYTIEGFNINSGILGGHNLQNIISSKMHDNKEPKYLHILIDQVDK